MQRPEVMLATILDEMSYVNVLCFVHFLCTDISMLSQLFTSKTRIKLLLKLFLNPDISCYLRELAKEFSLSPNALKGELDSLSHAGYLNREQSGRLVYYSANTSHPFYPEINSIVMKSFGIDKLVSEVVASLGHVDSVYLLDDYAEGRDTGLVDVLLIGDVDKVRLDEVCCIVEGKIGRKVRSLDVSKQEFDERSDVFLKRPHFKIF